tara:strand:- start:187 stop:486 length:300 start_codon:yes stop_codon:yes gene_type:complete
MVRSEIISKLLSKKIHQKLKKSDLDKVLQIILDSIVGGIKNNKSTELRGFGRFSVKKLKEKVSRNPRTGDKVYSPEKISIAFKMSKELRKKINENRTKN